MTNTFYQKIENCLNDYAANFTPEGTEIKAVIHQWMFAIAYQTDLFGVIHGVDLEKITSLLQDQKLFKTPESFQLQIRKNVHLNPILKPEFTFIDLFAGIGGMRQGFENNGGHCVFSSEFDKHAQSTYFDNYGDFPFGDITQIANSDLKANNWVNDIPDHDILIGGFPCQPFSHAGLKKGIEDTRGTLFDNIAQILESKKPKFALLENVKGLISNDQGNTLKIILRKLVKMGYQCNIDDEVIFGENTKLLQKEAKKMVLKSKDFGVPQNRQRIYIVLWRKELDIQFTYPSPIINPTRVSDILEKNPDPKYTISDKLWAGHQRRKLENKKKGKGFGYGIVTPESEYTNTISARYYKDGSECLISQELIGKNPRKLTPREAGNLQGFHPKFILNNSNVQAYKQFGNSVSVPVIEAIAKKICEVNNGN